MKLYRVTYDGKIQEAEAVRQTNASVWIKDKLNGRVTCQRRSTDRPVFFDTKLEALDYLHDKYTREIGYLRDRIATLEEACQWISSDKSREKC